MICFQEQSANKSWPRGLSKRGMTMRSLQNPKVVFIVTVFSLWAAVAPTLLLGQSATASISGRVTDSSSAAVPNATLTIRNTATSATQTTTTDEQGRYT